MMLSDTGGHSNRRNINITLFRFPPVSLKYYIGFTCYYLISVDSKKSQSNETDVCALPEGDET